MKNLSPGYFGLVMATGILATLFYKVGWIDVSRSTLMLGLTCFIILFFAFIFRAFILKGEVLDDLQDIQRMFKYLTFSAASNSLAVPLALFGHTITAQVLGGIGVASTIILTYTLFCALFFQHKASIREISPFWLLLAIACNSSGIAITSLWSSYPTLLLLAFGFWTFGVAIYLMCMTLNLFRMIFVPFVGEDMDPCYWTCMGAAAIAAVDGTQLLQQNLPHTLQVAGPFISGFVLFLWAWGTAWIPILCLMELWKYVYFRVPFHYQVSRWAMVFPLGMYTYASYMLGFQVLVHPFLWITLAAWLFVAFLSPFAKRI